MKPSKGWRVSYSIRYHAIEGSQDDPQQAAQETTRAKKRARVLAAALELTE
jgi:hypothetical protein